MANSIQNTMALLRSIRENYAQATAATDADWRLSDAAKQEARDKARDSLRASVADSASLIFGDTGSFWKERDGLKAKLRAARDTADTMEPARLANTYKRIPSIVAEARTLQELETWYRDTADSYERRAFQDTGAEAVVQRFPGVSEVGSFVAMLKRDRAESLATPEVKALERGITLLEQDAYNAHGELAKMVGEIGGDFRAEQVLSKVRVEQHFDDLTRLDAKARYVVEKRTDVGYIPLREPPTE